MRERLLIRAARIIAIMLGRLEMDVSESVRTYKDLLENVFGQQKHKWEIDFWGNIQARFDEALLQTAIEKTVAKKTEASTMFEDEQNRCTKT